MAQQHIRHKTYVKWSNEQLISKREQLMDLFTPNGSLWQELQDLLEIDRELTLREDT